MRKVLHNKRITVDELQTLLVEIEARVNNRPLTYISDTVNEPEALTPNHLLHGTTIESIPLVINTEQIKDPDFTKLGNITGEDLRKQFNKNSKLMKQWNMIWHRDYLTSLIEHHYGTDSTSIDYNLKAGDVVLIEGDQSRSTWPLGKIVALLPDRAGTLRLVKVFSKGIVSLRTIDKLIPLEIKGVDTQRDDSKLPGKKQERGHRYAAKVAREKWIKQLDLE